MKPYEPPTEDALSSTQQLYTSLSKSFPLAAANFHSLYAAWTAAARHDPGDSSARASGPEFDALVKLGPKIVPFVVGKLADRDGSFFFAVHLYDAVEKDEAMKVVGPGNVLDHDGLRRQADLILDMNHRRNMAFASKAAGWQLHQDENSLCANSTAYVSGDAYRSMVRMGPSVTGHIMDSYAGEPDGWWHEMLHQIVHGRATGPGTFFKVHLYAAWKAWFESGQPAP